MVPNKLIPVYEKELLDYVHGLYPEIPALIKDSGDLGDEAKINEICLELTKKFAQTHQLQIDSPEEQVTLDG